MKSKFIFLALLLIIIELIQYSACISLSNSTTSNNSSIYFNIAASASSVCTTSSDCDSGEGCYSGICYTLRKKLTAFLLSLFTGFFGVDWFYLSRGQPHYIIVGVFKLFSLGGNGVWWLADWINILCDGFKDGYALPLDATNF